MHAHPEPARPHTSRPRRCPLLWLADLYAAAALLYLLLRLLTGYSLWPVRLASIFAHWLLLPALPLLLVLLAARRWRHAAAMAAPVLAFVWLFGGLFLPNTPTASACTGDCQALTVLTYNMRYAAQDRELLTALLQEAGADVVALQEVSTAFEADLDAGLLAEYPYRAVYGDGAAGIGLLSRFPIVEHEIFYTGLEIFPYLEAVLDVDGQLLTVINAHAAPPMMEPSKGFHIRAEDDIPSLVERMDVAQPTLLLGDFNMTDQSAGHDMLVTAGLRDAFRAAGWGFGSTFPSAGRFYSVPIPRLIRIDYVWITPHFTVERAWVGPHLGSDHRPVLAELRLRAGSTD